jgi:hypothetical protein
MTNSTRFKRPLPLTVATINNAESINTEGSSTELVLNEYIPFVNDWCDCTGLEHMCGGVAFPDNCPNWQDNATSGGDPNLQHGKGLGTY